MPQQQQQSPPDEPVYPNHSQHQEPYVLVPPLSSQQHHHRAPLAPPAASSSTSPSTSSSVAASSNGNSTATQSSTVESSAYSQVCRTCSPPLWFKNTGALKRHRNKEHIMTVQVTVGAGEVYRVSRVDGGWSCPSCKHTSKDCEYLQAHLRKKPKTCRWDEKWPTLIELPASWQRINLAAPPPSPVPRFASSFASVSSQNPAWPAPPPSSRPAAPTLGRSPPPQSIGHSAPSHSIGPGSSSGAGRPVQPHPQSQQQYPGWQVAYPHAPPHGTAAPSVSRPAQQPYFRPTAPSGQEHPNSTYNALTGRFVVDQSQYHGSSTGNSEQSVWYSTPSAAPTATLNPTLASASDWAAWLGRLSPEERQRLLSSHPQLSALLGPLAQQRQQQAGLQASPTSPTSAGPSSSTATQLHWMPPPTLAGRPAYRSLPPMTSAAEGASSSAITAQTTAVLQGPSLTQQQQRDTIAARRAQVVQAVRDDPQPHQGTPLAYAAGGQLAFGFGPPVLPAEFVAIAARANQTVQQQQQQQQSGSTEAISDLSVAHAAGADSPSASAAEREVERPDREASLAGGEFELIDHDPAVRPPSAAMFAHDPSAEVARSPAREAAVIERFASAPAEANPPLAVGSVAGARLSDADLSDDWTTSAIYRPERGAALTPTAMNPIYDFGDDASMNRLAHEMGFGQGREHVSVTPPPANEEETEKGGEEDNRGPASSSASDASGPSSVPPADRARDEPKVDFTVAGLVSNPPRLPAISAEAISKVVPASLGSDFLSAFAIPTDSGASSSTVAAKVEPVGETSTLVSDASTAESPSVSHAAIRAAPSVVAERDTGATMSVGGRNGSVDEDDGASATGKTRAEQTRLDLAPTSEKPHSPYITAHDVKHEHPAMAIGRLIESGVGGESSEDAGRGEARADAAKEA